MENAFSVTLINLIDNICSSNVLTDCFFIGIRLINRRLVMFHSLLNFIYQSFPGLLRSWIKPGNLLTSTGCLLVFSAQTEIILIQGAPGNQEYAEKFESISSNWSKTAKAADLDFIQIGTRSSSSSPTPSPNSASTSKTSEYDSTSDRQSLQNMLKTLASNTGSDPLWLVYVGHGAFDGRRARLNFQGPDVTDIDLAEWIQDIQRPMVIILGNASSAPFIRTLSGPDRIVITATRSGSEESYCYFGEFFSQSFLNPNADLDLDKAVSILEAFLFTSRRVAAFYQENQRILMEHAVLEDTGDGLGIQADQFDGLAPKGDSNEGFRAGGQYLIPPQADLGLDPQWLQDRLVLEKQLADLKELKDSVDPQDYQKRLEKILLALARGYQSASAINGNP